MSSKSSTVKDQFIEFTNNVFCRREHNQRAAHQMWLLIRYRLPLDNQREFETEWNHYCKGEFDASKFSMDVERIKPYFMV